jgi:hypothetical protein
LNAYIITAVPFIRKRDKVARRGFEIPLAFHHGSDIRCRNGVIQAVAA